MRTSVLFCVTYLLMMTTWGLITGQLARRFQHVEKFRWGYFFAGSWLVLPFIALALVAAVVYGV